MKTELRKFVAIVSTLGLLASCVQTGTLERQNHNTSEIAEDIRIFADNDSIVKGYENTAKEMVWHQKLLKAIIPLPRCTVRSVPGLSNS